MDSIHDVNPWFKKNRTLCTYNVCTNVNVYIDNNIIAKERAYHSYISMIYKAVWLCLSHSNLYNFRNEKNKKH